MTQTSRRVADRKRARWGWMVGLLLVWPAVVCADESVQVADPYLELHTGPGRGYPIFYIAERGESVQILQRRTDWFKVRTAQDKEGWVSRDQMERTLTASGTARTFRDVLFDDYLQRRLEFGFSVGRFENDSILTAYAGYRVHENFVVELAVGESSGQFSSSSLIYAALVSQPYPDSRWSPFLALGVGQFENRPKATLVDARNVEADLANVSVGLRYYITRQFFLRGEFRDHVTLIDYNRTGSYQEWSLGVAFFF